LWFTTLDGVVRYDGAGVRVFNKANTRGIESNRFFELVEDRDGALWMATGDGGVTRYQDGAFSCYTTSQGPGSNIVNSIQLDQNGSLLVYTRPTFARWSSGGFKPYTPAPGEPTTGLGYRAPSGGLWFYDQAGLHRLMDGGSSLYQIGPGINETTSLC